MSPQAPVASADPNFFQSRWEGARATYVHQGLGINAINARPSMPFWNLMSSLICPMAGYKLGCLCVPRNLGAPGQSQGSYL